MASATDTARRSLEHPPGYAQNYRGSFEDSVQPDPGVFSPFQSHSSQNQSQNQSGLLGGDGSGAGAGVGGVWDTAVSWAKKAGEKMKEGEEEVWRRVNSGSK